MDQSAAPAAAAVGLPTPTAGRLALLAPLRRPTFRWLWAGMAASYGGDRLQQLAQAWLVATLSHSALSVGLITAFSSLAQLLMPLGGVAADQVDRRRLVLFGQLLGGGVAAVLAVLVVSGHVAVWTIYAWAFVSGIVWLVSRPAYKVLLTNAVPRTEVRAAVALNSMTETAESTLVNAGGSLLLAAFGLPLAFVINAASYFAAAGTLQRLKGVEPPRPDQTGLATARLLTDLLDGLRYLRQRSPLWLPLLITFALAVCVAPALSLLAAIVRAQGGSVVSYGTLAAATGVGSFCGATFAGSRDDSAASVRPYVALALLAGAALALFALLPVGPLTALPLAAIGFAFFCGNVWNKSRVRQLAADAYQGRLQSLVTMTSTLGFPIGAIWGGATVDHFGTRALLVGAAALVVIAVVATLATRPVPSRAGLCED